MSQKTLIFLITIFLIVFGFLLFGFRRTEEIEVKAASGLKSVLGWAWSENIGWISFSCSNTELPAPRCTNFYEVSVDSVTGALSGYAWSENIGWIKFDPPPDFQTGNYPTCPDSTCPPTLPKPNYPTCLDLPGLGQVCDGVGNYTVSGWARACAGTVNGDCNSATRTDGWDGWILLGPINKVGTDYGVTLDTSVSPNEFHGWAWGSDVVGWISFNHLNTGATVNYQVETSLDVNSPPTMSSVGPDGPPDYCTGSPNGQIGIKWTYHDADDDRQISYQLEVATDLTFSSSNILINCKVPNILSSYGIPGTSAIIVTSSPLNVCDDGEEQGTRTLQIPYTGAEVYWRISVQTENNPNYSNPLPGPSFTIPAHPYPSPDFTWSPLNPSTDRQIKFIDLTSGCSYSICPYPSAGYEWDFDDGSGVLIGDTGPTHTYSIVDTYHVTLKVTDTDNYSCSKEIPLIISSSLPEWKEIPPFH